MYFFRPDFDGWKINIASVYFLVQFGWKTNATWVTYFDVILKGKNLWLFWYLFFDKFLIY